MEVRLPGLNKKGEGQQKTEPKQAEVDNKSKSLSPEEKSKISTLIIRANELFYRGNYDGAFTLINQAETLDPQNAQVKAMKGSLLIETKHVKDGIQSWKESLLLNPDQPDLQKKIKEIEGSSK